MTIPNYATFASQKRVFSVEGTIIYNHIQDIMHYVKLTRQKRKIKFS